MCLSERGDWHPAKQGYQIKYKTKWGYTPLYFKGLERGARYRDSESTRDCKYQQLGRKYICGSTLRMIAYDNPPIRAHSYQAGFHVFHALRDAKDFLNQLVNDDKMLGAFFDKYPYAIVKVLVHKPTSVGTQYLGRHNHAPKWGKVTVCSEITLVKEVENVAKPYN